MRHSSTFAALVTALVSGSAVAALAQQPAELAYIASRDSAIRSLDARINAKEPFTQLNPVADSAVASLTGLLRGIIGPVHARGFAGPGSSSDADLYHGDEDFGQLDALVFRGTDKKSELWVSTPFLAARKGSGLIRDLRTALQDPDFYTSAIGPEAAAYRYASIPVPDARRLGVVEAMLMAFHQDDSPDPPDRLLVTVLRGQRLYIVVAPAAAVIRPPRRCTSIRDSLYARANAEPRAKYPPSNSADSAALDRSLHDEDAAEIEYLACYDKRAPLDPAFPRIVAQARAISIALPDP